MEIEGTCIVASCGSKRGSLYNKYHVWKEDKDEQLWGRIWKTTWKSIVLLCSNLLSYSECCIYDFLLISHGPTFDHLRPSNLTWLTQFLWVKHFKVWVSFFLSLEIPTWEYHANFDLNLYSLAYSCVSWEPAQNLYPVPINSASETWSHSQTVQGSDV